jgi:hypothetical protein
VSDPDVAGVWVEGAGSTFNAHSSKIHSSSDIAGATVRGAAAVDGGKILGYNSSIAATASPTSPSLGWSARFGHTVMTSEQHQVLHSLDST